VRGAKEAALLATEHCFERKSVVPERELLAQALKQSVGLASAQTTLLAVRDQKLIVAERDGRRYATTNEVLNEEKRMTDFARRGRGACPKLGSGSHEFTEQKLNDGQRRAVLHVLNSPDRVIVVRGAAGVGKTTATQAVIVILTTSSTRLPTRMAPKIWAASAGCAASEIVASCWSFARKTEALLPSVMGGLSAWNTTRPKESLSMRTVRNFGSGVEI
jgi:hypothetical protein